MKVSVVAHRYTQNPAPTTIPVSRIDHRAGTVGSAVSFGIFMSRFPMKRNSAVDFHYSLFVSSLFMLPVEVILWPGLSFFLRSVPVAFRGGRDA